MRSTPKSRNPRKAALLALPMVAGLLLAGCSSSDAPKEDVQAEAATNSAPLFAELPEAVQKAGTIQIGSAIDYPPFEYYEENGDLAGFEYELSKELEKQLGVSFKWNNASFDTLLPALTTKRYDIIFGAVNDTKEREESFDMISYLQSSQGLVSKAGVDTGIKTVEDLCGKSIAAVRGGIQPQYLEERSKVCVTDGMKPIEVLTFDGNSQEQLAVKQGRAVAMLENYPTAAYFAKNSEGSLEVVPDLQVEKRFFSMVLSKEQTELRDVLQKGWQAIIDDGSYDEILKKWDLDAIGIKTSVVNPVSEGIEP
ncbi:ABC transporter substrate-binding protein [Paeniglutamicibacter cryotolerans]|uniref:Polar amino acid transport system substrate-binding protein n=1 Tax=Paeniglutamicibacter cryotolerans TaxID=670079 RepID=A0A839QJT2_9MICC|nr:ABC transporter substrate-binding protein [Paeniglutamicibacter cryotolerans]MBB2996100.1 polar amino acid transport system substrate-binding protein [Paeniglutamicibacter cryotolerans]